MAWRRIRNNPLSEPMLNRFTYAYMRHKGEMSLLSELYSCHENGTIFYAYQTCSLQGDHLQQPMTKAANLCQKHVTEKNNDTQQCVSDVITCPCPWYLHRQNTHIIIVFRGQQLRYYLILMFRWNKNSSRWEPCLMLRWVAPSSFSTAASISAQPKWLY